MRKEPHSQYSGLIGNYIRFTIPLMQTWIRAGDFRFGRRLWASLKDNLVYYGGLGAVGLVFLIYTLVVMHIDKDALLSTGIAAANAWGLLLSTVMMGYGLVEIPRTLWFDANTQWCLRYMEFTAPRVKESMVDAEADLYDVAREIAIASRKIELGDALRPLVDTLMEKCPLALEERNIDREEMVADVNEDYLISLHARIKRAVKVLDRTQAQYHFLLQKAFLYQDVIENYRNKDRKFQSTLVTVPEDSFKDIKLRSYWWYYVWIRPLVLRFLSIIAVAASLAVIWSESTFQVESVTLSVPAVILKSPYIGYVALELVAMGFILYMCVCAYSTLFKIKFFDYYLVPEHHTDEGSLLFIGSYLCKLTFPLCYNFLNMVTDDETMFVTYQGKAVSLTPLLGEGYNKWLPEIVLIFALLTLFNMHGRLLRLFKIKHYSYYEAIAPNDADIEEGRQIIEQARAVEERKRTGGTIDSRFSNDITSTSRQSRIGSTRTAGTAKDLLAKYKSGGRFGRGAPSNDINSTVNVPAGTADGTNAGGLWTFKKANPFKGFGLSALKSPAVPTDGGGKFQRLEEDLESVSGREGFGSKESLNISNQTKSGRKFGVVSGTSTGSKTDSGGGGWGGLGSNWSDENKSAGGAGAQKTPPPSRKAGPAKAPTKNIFDGV
ncbi:hypothetical protein SpCBS45565_g07299 [Spizellomyces sp. 'palustris']|nr:hypothetical protein SpCBS45565_g07299 [Spizellomyces sp. 'palustris']